MIRTQQNVPEPYVDQSRDFQLLGRMYDCVVNGVKFDIDSMTHAIDTNSCRSNFLPLLQTKIGFFSEKAITDDELRYILKAFPTLIKNKGSILAIKQAIWMYLKLKHLKTRVQIIITGKNSPEPYTIRIGVETGFVDVLPLNEVLKYIIPTGYNIVYGFYTPITNTDDYGNVRDPMLLDSTAKVIYISDETNSAMRDSSYTDSDEDRIIGAVDTTEIICGPDITDLSNTLWEFNYGEINTNLSTMSINFKSNETTFTSIRTSISSSVRYLYFDNTIAYDTSNGWSNDAYKNITILDGNDVTNASLISWLQTNAVQSPSLKIYN